MIISYNATGTAANVGAGTTVTAVLPSGLMPGDLLITCIAGRGTIGYTGNATFWTAIANLATGNTSTTATTGSGSLYVGYHVYNGVTTPNNVFTASGTITCARWQMIALRGANPINPIGNTSTLRATAATTTPNTAGITCGANNRLMIVIGGGADITHSGYACATDPLAAGWSEIADSLTTVGADTTLSIAMATKNTSSGSTGTFTATGSGSTMSAMAAFEIRPYTTTRNKVSCS